MDPFEVRMQFLSLLHRLNASQQSIQKVVAYSLKYFSRCGDLIWDCIVEECQKGSLNTRINILYLLDSLCEASLLSKASFGPGWTSGSNNGNLYVDFVARDLATIVDYVVPPGREGLVNLMSAIQILENWRNKRVIETQKIEDTLSKLEFKKSDIHAAAIVPTQDAPGENAEESLTFSRNEVFKRIEEDRERHKRLRERRWVQPLVHGPQNVPMLATFAPLPPEKEVTTASSVNSAPQSDLNVTPKESTSTETAPPVPLSTSNSSVATPAAPSANSVPDLPLDIEFDNAWETTSDWNEDDDDAVVEENALCYPNAATRFDFGDGSGKEPPTTNTVAATREEYPPHFGPPSSFSFSPNLGPGSAPSAIPASSSGPAAYGPTAPSGPAFMSTSPASAQNQTRFRRPSFRIDRTRLHAYGERGGAEK